jgi:hypothetical protein
MDVAGGHESTRICERLAEATEVFGGHFNPRNIIPVSRRLTALYQPDKLQPRSSHHNCALIVRMFPSLRIPCAALLKRLGNFDLLDRSVSV